nr:hypothetical protein B0A51_02465 [Rachicladosporium sp. CCFEE 5018]
MAEKDIAVLAEKDSTTVKSQSPSPVASAIREHGEAPYIDPEVEKRILRKLDWRVVPVLWFLFLVSFIDRGNIGNAKIQGMDKSLHLVGNRYNMAVMVFTLAYVVFGVPANIVFKLVGPKSLSAMMFIWGFLVMGQGFTRSYAGLVVCRFLMGIFEAGFVPGCAYLIGSYYKRNEFLRRYTVFFSAAIAAGAFNGLFATLLAMADGTNGLEGWRWIFIVEGIITSSVSVLAYFVIPELPEKTSMFNAEEKAVLLERLRQDGGEVVHGRIGKHVMEALLDWKVWLATLTYIGAEENASSVVAFQPTVLKGLGYTSTQAQLHSIPIYVVAFVVSLTCAWLSERLGQRYLFTVLCCFVGIVGLAIELAQPKSANVRYAGMFFLAAGGYIVMPIQVVWLAINVGKGYKRTVAFGMVIAVGNCGAFISSNVFLTSEAPKYHLGFSVGMGMFMLATLTSTLMYIGLRMENKKRDRNARADLSNDEELTGEKHPDFRYHL